METFDIELAINYCTFENFKQKAAQILNNLFAQGRINDYARFHSYGIITPMDEKNRHIHIEEIDKSLNRAGTQIKSMFKILAADVMIKCMIFFIIVTIIAILVISFFSDTGGKNMKNDTFKNGE